MHRSESLMNFRTSAHLSAWIFQAATVGLTDLLFAVLIVLTQLIAEAFETYASLPVEFPLVTTTLMNHY